MRAVTAALCLALLPAISPEKVQAQGGFSVESAPLPQIAVTDPASWNGSGFSVSAPPAPKARNIAAAPSAAPSAAPLAGKDQAAGSLTKQSAMNAAPAKTAPEKAARREDAPSSPAPRPQPGLAPAKIEVRVSIKAQRMEVRHNGVLLHEWPVSTAGSGKVTPKGTFRAQWLSRDHKSSLYNNAPMPYAIFYSGDYAIHGTDQEHRLGRPASAGCVRLSEANARTLFGMVLAEGKEQMEVRILE